MLLSLGFTVERTQTGNHRKVKHPGLRNFFGSGYDCGHGANPQIKKGYAGKLKKMLMEHRTELEAYLEQDND